MDEETIESFSKYRLEKDKELIELVEKYIEDKCKK